jgi:hypothetical protein
VWLDNGAWHHTLRFAGPHANAALHGALFLLAGRAGGIASSTGFAAKLRVQAASLN